MIITKIGKYKVLDDFTTRNTITISRIFKGNIIKITQIDAGNHKVIGPSFLDWIYWDLPVMFVAKEAIG
ncbi:MAG TPA: hypothetical protein ENH82_13170 [bacterium]|nr:hypothetical protein [bacterium]